MQTQSKLVKSSFMSRSRTQVVPVMAQERKIMDIAAANHWPFRILGVAPVPERPIYLGNWWLVPGCLDSSTIPERAMERVRALYEAGISPKAFVIAHQAEKQLAPPPGTQIVSPVTYWAKVVGDQSLAFLKGAGKVIAVVAPVILGLLGTSLLLSLTVAGALVADPVLCAVTEDDVWIQIDEWMA